MEDTTVNSQVAEVFWDCGSPSPSAWRSCQVSLSNTSSEKGKPLASLQKNIAEKKRQKNAFHINSKSLDKARAIIAQFQATNTDVQAGNSSYDMLFDQSGGNEELPSSVSTLPSVDRRQAATPDKFEAIPSEFWTEDAFSDDTKDTLTVGLQRSTSTPLAETKTTLSLKRKHSKKAGKDVTARTCNKKLHCLDEDLSNEDDSMLGVFPFSPCGKRPGGVDSKSGNSASHNANTCADFLLSFNSPKRRPTLKRSGKHARSDRLSTKVSTIHGATKENDITISDEILSQLVMDDSWTVSCTNDVKKSPKNCEPIAEQPQFDSILVQLMKDDSWSSCCPTNATPSSNLTTKEVKENSMRKNDSSTSSSTKPNLVTCPDFSAHNGHTQNLPELPPTLPIPELTLAVATSSCKTAPTTKMSPQSRTFIFKPSSRPPSSLQPQKCSVAEIEQKRLQALRRKRMKSKK